MKKIISFLLLFNYLTLGWAEKDEHCLKGPKWLKTFCRHLHQTWTEGDNELYLSGYAWHNRYLYSKSRLRTYNEKAWGGGFGKGFYDERGNWHGLAAIAFLDSHKKIEPAVGYAFQKIAHFTSNFNFGIGYAILATIRPDMYKGRPFIGLLPWTSITYRKASIMATYIPGSSGAGNVFYLIGKLQFSLF